MTLTPDLLRAVSAELKKAGYVRRYTIVCGPAHGHKRYVVAWAHPTRKYIVEFSEGNIKRTRTLEALGWRFVHR